MGSRFGHRARDLPRRSVWLLAAALLAGLVYLLGPWAQSEAEGLASPQSNLDGPADPAAASTPSFADPSPGDLSSATGATLPPNEPATDPSAQRLAVDRTAIHGRLRFPDGVAVPVDARVFAVERSRGRGAEASARLQDLIRSGEQGTNQVRADGRFQLQLPGLDPIARGWFIYAGAPGWAGSVVFPDVRPSAAGPDEEFEVLMEPVFGATIELVTPTGGRPRLDRDLLRESGGAGLYVNGRWSVRGPLLADSAVALLSVPPGLPPLVGGQDPSIGVDGAELAIQIFRPDEGADGEFHHMYQLEFPGYEPIKEVLRFGPLAAGDVPHHRLVLRPLEALGELHIQFDRASWWNRELGPHDASGLRLRLFRTNSPNGAKNDEMELNLDGVPENGELMLQGVPSGRYRLDLFATHSKVAVPLLPAEVQVPEAGFAQIRADCGEFGAIELAIAAGCAGEWSSGRIEFLALDEEQMRSFQSEQWPVFLGPLPVSAGSVILLRSLDRKTPPQVADRLNHPDEYPIVDGVTTRYAIQGTL